MVKPTTATETPAKKKSATQIVIEEKMLPQLVSGSVWKRNENETDEEYSARIIHVRSTLGRFLKSLKTACKMFDTELTNQRNILGSDHLTGVEWFRKPRTKKEGTETDSLMDEFAFDEDDD
jgi:hypothetical protein